MARKATTSTDTVNQYDHEASTGNVAPVTVFLRIPSQTAGLGRTITWSSYNRPQSITQGTTTLSFEDDTEHQRVKQTAPEGTTLYLRDPGSGLMVEQFSSAIIQWNEYLVAGGQVVGVRFERSDGTAPVRYFHKDHLGSICALTDESGTVVQRIAYDAWGRQRYETGATDPTNSITSQTTKSFTGEERLADVNLVHLNARVYDPIVQKFLSADGMVESPFSTQGWNRYAYVGNNPLSFTGPSGQCFLGCFWKSIFHFFQSIFRSVPFLGDILEIAVAAFCGPLVAVCAAEVGATAFAIAGITSGKLGVALKAGLIAAATVFANFEIGQLTTPTVQVVNGGLSGAANEIVQTTSTMFGSSAGLGSANFFANVALHAALGCASAEASSGHGCGSGALAGGVSAASGPILRDAGLDGLIERSAIGGLASVAGGGKFGNGALTAAFDYLFNDNFHQAGGHIDEPGDDEKTLTLYNYPDIGNPDSGDMMRFICDTGEDACDLQRQAAEAQLAALLGVPAAIGGAEATGIAVTYRNFTNVLRILHLLDTPLPPDELEPPPIPPIQQEMPPRPGGTPTPKP